jgi:GxxExxY protein
MKHQGREERQEHQEPDRNLDKLAKIVVDAGLKVHRTLGPGLLESAYEHCLAHELRTRGIAIQRQLSLPVVYEGLSLECGYRLDLLVENSIVVELKAVDALTRVHEAQVLTYLRLSGHRLGFLMNFNVVLFKEGVKRFVI